MTDPYQVLGVSPSASDDEVREAYRKLSLKFHPDLHNNSPLSDLAEEKMKELNAAFDQVMDMRRGGANQPSGDASYQYGGNAGRQDSGSQGGSAGFSEIRRQVQTGNVTRADSLLENSSLPRNAEWNFLKGSVCYARGWLNDAFQYFAMAVNMEPANMEYRAALNQMNQSRQGAMNGNPNPYRQAGGGPMGGCSACDMCQGLICADCCCECMGGDLISCC